MLSGIGPARELDRHGIPVRVDLPGVGMNLQDRYEVSVVSERAAIMAAGPHPEQGFRTCLGILALTRAYGDARVDAACRRGVAIKARSVASIRSILQNGLDRAFLDEDGRSDRAPVRHVNIRGRDYFH